MTVLRPSLVVSSAHTKREDDLIVMCIYLYLTDSPFVDWRLGAETGATPKSDPNCQFISNHNPHYLTSSHNYSDNCNAYDNQPPNSNQVSSNDIADQVTGHCESNQLAGHLVTKHSCPDVLTLHASNVNANIFPIPNPIADDHLTNHSANHFRTIHLAGDSAAHNALANHFASHRIASYGSAN
eukprot:gene4376-5382_t